MERETGAQRAFKIANLCERAKKHKSKKYSKTTIKTHKMHFVCDFCRPADYIVTLIKHHVLVTI